MINKTSVTLKHHFYGIIAILSIFLFFMSCTTYSIVPYVGKDDVKNVERGQVVITEKEDDVSVSVITNHKDSYHKYSVLIENFGDETVFFDDNNLKVYQGNYDKDQWEEIDTHG